jgi:hypothetical protein
LSQGKHATDLTVWGLSFIFVTEVSVD